MIGIFMSREKVIAALAGIDSPFGFVRGNTRRTCCRVHARVVLRDIVMVRWFSNTSGSCWEGSSGVFYRLVYAACNCCMQVGKGVARWGRIGFF